MVYFLYFVYRFAVSVDRPAVSNPTLKQTASNLIYFTFEQEIFRKALDKSPGERLGRLDKQGRFVPDRLMEKRSAYLNVSSIEELLDRESIGDDSAEEPGCYIEIKIVSQCLYFEFLFTFEVAV